MFTTLPGMQLTTLTGLILAAFNPATQFSAGQLGAWYDPSEAISAPWFQDSAGTAPVTAVEQPIGRAIDKSGRGNHLLQATATARSRHSALINQFTKSGTLYDAAAWEQNIGGFVVSSASTAIVGPDGSANNVTKFVSTATPAVLISRCYGSYKIGPQTSSMWFYVPSQGGITNWAVQNDYNDLDVATPVYSTVFDQWVRVPVTTTLTAARTVFDLNILPNGAAPLAGFVVYVSNAQLESGPATTRYQRVNTATDYDTVGFPFFAVFDGIDDGMATGAITLSADMDCFIAVRRATTANVVLVSPTINSGSFFGVVESAGAAAADAGSGTPTYAANGVSLNGGLTGTTRGQLHTALPAASWVVLEVRNLTLTGVAWSALVIGNYTGFTLNGDFGGMILAPAGDAAQRQKNRQYLGNKVGLTLP